MSERVTTARVRELRDGATPGRWEAGAVRVYATAGCPRHAPDGDALRGVHCRCRTVTADASDQDRALIAAAPDLAADLLEAREEAARLRETADFWQRQHGVAVLVRDGDIAAWKGEAARLRAIVESATRRELVAVDYVAG